MTFWERLLRSLGLRPYSKRSFRLDARLVYSIHALAKKEQRPAEEVAAELLTGALLTRQEAEARLARFRELSRREQEVTALICLGFTNEEIGQYLVISTQTVKVHVHSILTKFNLHSKAKLREYLADWDFSNWANNRWEGN